MKRKLAAILCAGAEGYSRLMGEDESGTLTTLKAHLQFIGSPFEKHGGRVMAIHGDTLLAGFDSVVDAVQCAVEIWRRNRLSMLFARRGCNERRRIPPSTVNGAISIGEEVIGRNCGIPVRAAKRRS